jgi:L-aminopeptidase/D-esterase-like protein
MGGSITEIAGILVGHADDALRGSGVTVLLFPGGAMAVADIRGEASGTCQMDSILRPHPVRKIHALVFAGGSAFGLDAASGVVRYLEERNIGFSTPGGIVPIAPTAVVYDLGYGDSAFRPDSAMGYAAACAASSHPPERGSVGAGAGATVGKILGISRAMKGGFGSASDSSGGAIVGACAVVNAFGDVVDPETGRWIAGARAVGKETPAYTEDLFRGGYRREPFSAENTTLAVIATADLLTRDELGGVARMGHAALCRAIRPVHTPMDGDIVVAVATGASGQKGNALQAAALGTRALEKAIVDAVLCAKGTGAVPAAADLQRNQGK